MSSALHQEYWIPAGELEEFNRPIEAIARLARSRFERHGFAILPSVFGVGEVAAWISAVTAIQEGDGVRTRIGVLVHASPAGARVVGA